MFAFVKMTALTLVALFNEKKLNLYAYSSKTYRDNAALAAVEIHLWRF